jgi:hypothetical protein
VFVLRVQSAPEYTSMPTAPSEKGVYGKFTQRTKRAPEAVPPRPRGAALKFKRDLATAGFVFVLQFLLLFLQVQALRGVCTAPMQVHPTDQFPPGRGPEAVPRLGFGGYDNRVTSAL